MDNSIITAAGSALVLVINHLVIALRKHWRGEGKMIEQIQKDLNVIRKEVLPNGGKSLADRIAKIDTSLVSFQDLAEQRWRITLDNSDKPIFLNDKTGKCIYVNKALADLFRMDRGEMLDDGWAKRLRNPDIHFAIWMNFVTKGIPYLDRYTLLDDKGKKYATVKATSGAVLDSSGNVIFYYGTCTDTSDTLEDTYS